MDLEFEGIPNLVDFTEKKNNEYPNTILRLSPSTCEARESPAGPEPAADSDHVPSFSLWKCPFWGLPSGELTVCY